MRTPALRTTAHLGALVAFLVCLAFLALGGRPACSAAVDLTDDTGRRVTLGAPAKRVVSLSPHLTELLFLVGAGASVVGTVQFSDYPDAARSVPRIGDARGIDLERIAALRPDLVVAWASGNAQFSVERLASLGVALYRNEPRTLDDIARSLSALGTLTGHVEDAAAEAGRFRERLARLRSQYASTAPVTVFYQVGDSPLLTVSRRHVIDDALRTCGGTNVFAALPGLVPPVDVESVLGADPQVIVAAVAQAERTDPFLRWRDWTRLRAVRSGHLVTVATEQMHRSTPRILDAVDLLCADLDRVRKHAPRERRALSR